MPSKTQIGNTSLGRIGINKAVANVDTENSAEARQILRVYDDDRDAVLRRFAWPFASRYATLQLVSNPDQAFNYDWFYAYRFPADAHAVRRIVTPNGRAETAPPPFEIAGDAQGQLVLTDWPEAIAKYTAKVTDPNRFDALFVSALAWKIAASIAPALSRIKDMGTKCAQMYEYEISTAAAAAFNETQSDPAPDAELIRARE